MDPLVTEALRAAQDGQQWTLILLGGVAVLVVVDRVFHHVTAWRQRRNGNGGDKELAQAVARMAEQVEATSKAVEAMTTEVRHICVHCKLNSQRLDDINRNVDILLQA